MKDTMRNDNKDKWTYQDNIFYNEINKAIIVTAKHYENAVFREAVKTGFYDLQVNYFNY